MEYYDEEADVYYVTFETGEPSSVVEVDDVILLEVGVYSHALTGFRVLGYKKQNYFRDLTEEQFMAKVLNAWREVPRLHSIDETLKVMVEFFRKQKAYPTG